MQFDAEENNRIIRGDYNGSANGRKWSNTHSIEPKKEFEMLRDDHCLTFLWEVKTGRHFVWFSVVFRWNMLYFYSLIGKTIIRSRHLVHSLTFIWTFRLVGESKGQTVDVKIVQNWVKCIYWRWKRISNGFLPGEA